LKSSLSNRFDRFAFRIIDVANITNYIKDRNLFAYPEVRAKIEYLKAYPGISGSFPCLFCFEASKGEIICSVWAIPDRLHCYGGVYSWAWLSSLMTSPAHQRRGFAAYLLGQAIKSFHAIGCASGGMFATSASKRLLTKRLGMILPGYVSRLFLVASFDLLLETHIPDWVYKRFLVSLLRIFSKRFIRSVRTQAVRWRRAAVSKAISWNDMNVIDSEIRKSQPKADYWFANSGTIALLKASAAAVADGSESNFYSLETRHGERIGYFILRRNWQQRALRGNRRGFWRVTLIDYGISLSYPGAHRLLAKEVVFRFLESGAALLDVASSEKPLMTAFRKSYLIGIHKKASLNFTYPSSWHLQRSCMDIKHWHLTRSSGDGFLF